MHLFVILVGRCLRKVGGLAASVLGEFREGTQPPCSGAQTRLARQGCSTHVHAQMNARWEVGWGAGSGGCGIHCANWQAAFNTGPWLLTHTHTNTAVVPQCTVLSLSDITRSVFVFFYHLSPPGFIFCKSSLTARWNSCNKA